MKLIYLLFIFIITSFASSGKSIDYNFREITPPGGLSFQGIHSIVQDKQGNIWLGTYDGIYKYDSRDFKRFAHVKSDSLSLSSNATTSLIVDNNNVLWVSTQNGLNRFSYKTQSFVSVKYTDENNTKGNYNIRFMCIDSNNDLWIIDDIGVGRLNTITNKIQYLFLPTSSATSIYIHDNIPYMSTADGSVYRVNTKDFTISFLISKSDKLINCLLVDDDYIWIAYDAYGLKKYTRSGKLVKTYIYDKSFKWNLENCEVRSLSLDKSGNLWIGTYRGLYIERKDVLYRIDNGNVSSFSHRSIFSIFQDNQEGIWVGTWAGGLNYYHFADSKFNVYRSSNNKFSLSNNVVSSFAQISDNEIYVGTEVGGLNLFNKNSETFERIKLSDNIYDDINIKSLTSDKYNSLWVASYNYGLWHRPLVSGSFVNFTKGPEDGSHISGNKVYCVFATSKGVWIGNDGGGADFYDFETRKIKFLKSIFPDIKLPCNNVRSIFVDSNNYLWIGTYRGLFCINDGKLVSYGLYSTNSLLSDQILSISELSDGKIYVGTKSGGVNIIDTKHNQISYFDAHGLLKNSDVYGVIEDKEKNIWISSKKGLIYCSENKKHIRQFLSADGIQGDVFNPMAIFKDYDDNLYFGGTNGFSTIVSEKVKLNKRPPEILLDKIIVNNKDEIFFKYTCRDSILSLKLNADQTNLEIKFTADNFLLSAKNHFKYRLLGFNDDWITVGYNKSAIFTNIPSGNYTFELMASNNDGVWNSEPYIIDIYIATYWWKSTLAIIIYCLLLFLILFIIVRSLSDRQKLRKEVLIAKIQREKEDEVHEMKLKFFTNISHELRTPLSLINGPVKKLLKNEDITEHECKDLLMVILRNSNRLLSLVGKIINIRSLDSSRKDMNLSNFDICDFINIRCLNFSHEAQRKNIKFEFIHTDEQLIVNADKEMIDKIVFNLLSNAFKYTSHDQTIILNVGKYKKQETVSYENQLSYGKLSSEEFLEISLEDTGKGIKIDNMVDMFKRFQKGENDENVESSGIGLSVCKEYTLLHNGEIIVKSTYSEGSQFIVRIPLVQKNIELMYGDDATNESEDIIIKKNAINENVNSDTDVVLVVEDNADLRRYIIGLLSTKYKILEADNAIDAINIVNDNACSIIISDVMMPNMTGLEFCDKIKTQDSTSHIPIILLTALADVKNEIEGLKTGADAYITKPFDEDLLVSQVHNLLSQRDRLRKSYIKNIVGKEKFEETENSFLKKLDHFLEQRYTDEEFSVEILAKDICLHRSQLHRKLKHLTNYSATEYIRMFRLKKAAILLQKDNNNIDEISFMIGFSSHSYFSRCFKELFNMSPKQYREHFNNKVNN